MEKQSCRVAKILIQQRQEEAKPRTLITLLCLQRLNVTLEFGVLLHQALPLLDQGRDLSLQLRLLRVELLYVLLILL